MTGLFRELYETLLNGIEENKIKYPDLKGNIEACFHLCESVRSRVERSVSDTSFSTPAEEIDFFKNVKPLFTTLVEFYSILYRVELFIPETKADQIEFWDYELQRAQLFQLRNIDLLQYLKERRSEKDSEYFLRGSTGRASAPIDELVARLLAREKYIDYINNNILPGINP